MEVENLTYYDSEGIRHLVQRVLHVIEGMPEPPNGRTGKNLTAKQVNKIVVDYYGGAGPCSVSIKRGSGKYGPGEERLRVAIARRTKLFGSELEAIAELSGEEPVLPPDVMLRLGCAVLKETSPWDMRNALRQQYPDLDLPHSYSSWPEACAQRLVQEEILPCCEVRIKDRSESGSAHRKKLLLAKDKYDAKQWAFQCATLQRQALQEDLEKAIEMESRAEVALIKARATLNKLKNKEK